MSRFRPYLENKYLVSLAESIELQKRFAAICAADQHGDNGSYEVLSIYYDTLNFDFLEDKLQGEFDKIKVRIRFYRSLRHNVWHDPCLEIKQKTGHLVSKHRVGLSAKQADACIKAPQLFEVSKLLEACQLEQQPLNRLLRLCLRPVVAVYYQRQAMESNEINGLRFTLDSTIACRDVAAKIFSDKSAFADLAMMLNLGRIFEIKANVNIPEAVLNQLEQLEIAQQSFSKYASSLLWLREHFSTFAQEI